MPLWNIYHTETIFQDKTTRDAFAATITESYARLPAFYVVVNFIQLESDRIYRSGKPVSELDKPFVRLVISHLAVHAKDNTHGLQGPDALASSYASARAVIDRGIKEHVVDKGYYWEYSVTEEDRHLWMIDGFQPPKFGGGAFKVWKEGNKAVAYGDEDKEPI